MRAPRRLLFSPRAAADLDEIAAYIARDNPAGVRMAVFRRYLVLFREEPEANAVRIERVVHGARNLRRLI